MDTWTLMTIGGIALVGCVVGSGAERKPVMDRLENAAQYTALHPAFAKAFAFLRRPDLAALEPGKHLIDGEKVFCTIAKGAGKKKEEARLEAHRKYIDIQYVVAGADEIGWRPTAACQELDQSYDAASDIMFFKDKPEAWLKVTPKSFVIFFPKDAHAPMISDGPLHKVVVKIAVE
jgi:biofilm protein TabA